MESAKTASKTGYDDLAL
jgi:hypothetical protein